MIALLFMLLGCASEPPRQSVLLLTISGVRADRVGAYGYNPSDTPHLDALAAKGTKFTRAYATSTDVGAALNSIMMGLQPPAHGRRTSKQRGGYSAGSYTEHRSRPSGVTGGGKIRRPGFERLTRSNRESGLGFLTTLAEHGYGVDSTVLGDFPKGKLRHFSSTVMEMWFFDWKVHDADSIEAWAVHFPALVEDDGRTMSVGEYDAALREYDVYIGKLLDEWSTFRPDGYVVVAGVTGSMNGARADAAIGLTDDLLRVPLVLQGPGVEAGWEVSEVVSTVDVAATIADFLGTPFESQGRNLLSGGSELAYHESTYGYERFNTRPLVGYTETSGRYVEGVYGRWSIAVKEKVLPFEMPTSEYPEKAQTLAKLRAGFGPDQGLPDGAWSLQLDVRERERLDSLANKLERAIANGRTAAATRILIRLRESAPSAPIVSILEGKLQKLSTAVPD
jgi:hypothetical protein